MKQNLRAVAAMGLSMVFMTLSACSCGDDSDNININVKDKENSGDPDSTELSSGFSVRGVVQDTQGNPLGNVAVMAKNATATTDAQGRYQLRLFDGEEGEHVIRFSRSGYVHTIKKVPVFKDHATMFHVKLLAAERPKKLVAEDGGEIEGTIQNKKGNVVKAKFPKNALVNAKGDEVTGEVSVRLTNIDPSMGEADEAAPGSFIGFLPRSVSGEAADLVAQIESGGMLEVDVRNASGEKLQLKTGEKLEVWFPVPNDLQAPPDKMHLWSFDEEKGQWLLEEMDIELSADKQHYIAHLPHMSLWNADMPFTSTCVMGCAKDKETGEPLAGAQVLTSGLNYVGNSQATTDAEGCFRVAVRKSSPVQITVRHSLNGGTSRPFHEVGNTDTLVPPTPSDICVDAGLFEVERDVFNYDGLAVDCTSAMASLSGNACQEAFGEMMACTRAVGACAIDYGYLDPEGKIEDITVAILWDSGARMVTSLDTSNPLIYRSVVTAFGPGGNMCYSATILTTSRDDDSLTFKYTNARGMEFKYERMPNNQMVVECSNGQRFELSGAESTAMLVCKEQESSQRCSADACRALELQTGKRCEEMAADYVCCEYGEGFMYSTCSPEATCFAPPMNGRARN